MGTGPPYKTSKCGDGSRIPWRWKSEPESGPIGGGQRSHLAVEQGKAQTDDGKGDDAAPNALKDPLVVERPADERIGGADEAKDVDLFALREDLNSDGIEGDGDRPPPQQGRKQPEREARDRRERRKPTGPHGVRLYRCDGRQLAEIGDERLEALVARTEHRRHDIGVRQRI